MCFQNQCQVRRIKFITIQANVSFISGYGSKAGERASLRESLQPPKENTCNKGKVKQESADAFTFFYFINLDHFYYEIVPLVMWMADKKSQIRDMNFSVQQLLRSWYEWCLCYSSSEVSATEPLSHWLEQESLWSAWRWSRNHVN